MNYICKKIILVVILFNMIYLWAQDEFVVDTNIIYRPHESEQSYPDMIFGTTTYLVVWEDYRSGSDTDIYAARISPSGSVLDGAGIAISTPEGQYHYPKVAFDGTNFLIVWREYGDIYGARVSQDGTVIDPDGIHICADTCTQNHPSVAFDGTNYFVVWEDNRNYQNSSTDIYGARVSPSGVILDTVGVPISTATQSQDFPSIAFDGVNYLVVWNDGRNHATSYIDIYGTRVNQSGVVLDTGGIAISTAPSWQDYPKVAFDGVNYCLVWSDGRSDQWGDIYGARVTMSGTVLDTSGIAISVHDERHGLPTIVFGGQNYFVTWPDTRSVWHLDIYGTRVATDGTVIDTAGIPISTEECYQSRPSLGFDGTNFLAVWQDWRNDQGNWDNSDIYGARITASGSVVDSTGIVISTCANSQYNPSVAFHDTSYFVVWEDWRNQYPTLTDIYGIRVSQSGAFLDDSAIVVSTAPDSQKSPSVVFGGANYFVAWTDNRDYNPTLRSDIYGARVTASGNVLDPNGFAIVSLGNWQTSPASAFGDTNYLTVWDDNRTGSYDMYGARISQAGIVLEPDGFTISAADYYQVYPSVTFNGTDYFVVWQDNRHVPWDIYGARVSTTGQILDSLGIAISTAQNHQEFPSIAFDGINYLVAWQDMRSGNNYDIYATRITQTGIVLDSSGLPISCATHDQLHPVVAFDGTDYIIVWEDYRDGSTCDIYGAKVSTSGTVINTYLVSAQNGNQIQPTLIRGNGDQILILYSGWTDYVSNHQVDAMRIWGRFYPFVGIEENVELRERVTKLALNIYPNPVYKKCNIEYGLPQETNVNISLFDVTGRLVKEVINEKQNVGIYNETLDFTDLSQGVYFIKLKTESHSETKKAILMK